LLLVFSRVFVLVIDDKSGIAVNAMAKGFINTLERLPVDDFDQYLPSIFLGQLFDPIREIEVFFL